MKCSNCGKEIKEGNSFCTNCGTKVALISNNNNTENIDKEQANIPLNANIPNADNNVDNANVVQNEVNNIKAKKKIPIAVKIIIPLVVILVIILIIVLFNNKDNEEISTDEVIEEIEAYSIETGVNYNCNNNGVTGYLKFNTETAFIIKMNYDMEYVEYTGTYTIDDDIITLTITYDGMTEDIETFEPYTETMTILEDETIEWITEIDTYIFDKNITLDDDTTSSTGDLLEQIYALYPELENTEGIICTDGESYWLLDESGNKVYFSDIDSFESALTQCNIDVTSSVTTSNTSTSSNNTSMSTSSKKSSNTSSSSTSSSTTTTKTMYIDFHRSCLASNFLEVDNNGNLTLTKNLSVKVTANGTTIFSDTITKDDLIPTGTYNCKTSLVTYTGTEAPTIIVYVDGETFRTYSPSTTIDWFDSSSQNPYFLGFNEHGAG